ncbi:MAG TPA: polysaccharide biosynthesis tyrosine autokinase [Terriglobia bacterium]|nr:polysaccharide biosynthesis tyrosine autokinase [Terriglobia bacterium]
MDELERRHPQLSTEALSRSDSADLELQPIVDVSSEEVPHLLDYWALILKRRWVVISCIVVVFTTVAIGTLKERPIYRGTVLLEIDPEAPNVVNFKEVVSPSPVDISAYLETQYKILKSRSLAQRVVNDLQLYRTPEFYRSYGFMGFTQHNPEVLPSPSEPDANTSADYYRNSVTRVQNSIGVDPVRRSNLVEVSFDSYNPETAAKVANEVAQDYINQNLQVKWNETTTAANWLQGKMVDLQQKLEEAQRELQAYAAGHDILYLTGNENFATAQMQSLLAEYSAAQGEMYAQQGLYSLVKKGKIEDLPGVLNNLLIQSLEESLVQEQSKYAKMMAQVKPAYPLARQEQRQIKRMENQLKVEKGHIIQNIVDQYHSDQHRVRFLAKAIDQQKKVMNETNKKLVQYNILKESVDSNKELYQGLLQRMKQAQVSAGLNASNIRIVDTAIVSHAPVKPRVFLNLAIGLVLGTALGIGLAFFQEYLDKTMKTSDDVERLVRLPSLGVLPKFALNGAHGSDDGVEEEALVPVSPNGNGHMAPAIQTAPEVAEAFRSLRTSILLSASPVPKLLLITSALPSEGKTTTAVNLGATLASLNTKVVIVDCDMRRPACHRSTGVENKPGFVQCLTGHVDVSQAVLPVPGVPLLSVIPCGPIPPNPAEVLSSRMTGDLLRRLRNEFEFVLVDSPPLLSVADSRILATLTDAAVLVTRAHSTPYDIVRRARSLLYQANARILGVALNDVDFRKDGYGYAAGNYGYGYGYGYGNGSNGDGAGSNR